MYKLVLLITLLLIGTGVFAQSDTPGALVGLIEAGDFRALAVTDDGQYLLVSDVATNQVRVYDLRTPSSPSLVNSISVDGIPGSVASGRDFGFVATSSGDSSTSTLEVIAPSLYNSAGAFARVVNYVDLPFQASDIVVSPDKTYGVVLGANQYALLQLNSAEEIDARVFNQALDTAALSNDMLIYAVGSNLSAARLDGLSDPQQVATVEVRNTVSAIAVEESGKLGALGLANGDVLLFDPDTLDILDTVTLTGTPRLMQFGESRLAIVIRGQQSVTVLDTTGRALRLFDQTLSSSSVNSAIRAIATFPGHVATTDGTDIAIFALP